MAFGAFHQIQKSIFINLTPFFTIVKFRPRASNKKTRNDLCMKLNIRFLSHLIFSCNESECKAVEVGALIPVTSIIQSIST